MNPAQFRLLLAGPKVGRLLPFFAARGYVADAASSGEEALDHMRTTPRHLLLVELELEDMMFHNLLEIVRRENLAGAVILMDDPAKSGLIVSALLKGIDGYVATPPDELYLFRIVERQLLAQWAMAQSGQQAAEAQEKQRLEKAVQMERGKVTELVKEIASLREEVTRLKTARNAEPRSPPPTIPVTVPAGLGKRTEKPTTPPAGPQSSVSQDELDTHFDDALDADTDFSEALTQHRVRNDDAPRPPPPPVLPANDARTSPVGWAPPPALRKPAPAAVADVEFDLPRTSPGDGDLSEDMNLDADLPATRPKVPAQVPKDIDDASESDLFLDLDEDTSEVALERKRQAAATAADKPVARKP